MNPSVAVGPAVEATKCISGAVSRRIDYLKNLEGNFEELGRKVRHLNARVEDVKTKIARKKASKVCDDWLKQTDTIQNKWTKIEDDYKKIEENNKTCLGGWCPNIICSRLNLAKRIMALIPEVDDWKDQYAQIKEDLVIDEPAPFVEMPPPGVDVKIAVDHTVQELLGMIKNGSITKIGLSGMGGIGKTTIMKVLHDRQEIRQMFDLIIWVTVTKEGTNTSVRQQLAESLDLKVEGTNPDILKGKVYEKLKDKNFLLLLDDVWGYINLEEVGVPSPVEGKVGKVLLSSRTHEVFRHMSTDREIKVEALSEEAAWSLFCRKVGEIVVRDSKIEAIAREVVRECDGLPLALLVVGGTLRNVEDIRVWRNVLNELRSSAGEINAMEDKVYSRLRTSYDQLKDVTLQQCFLYCALFPEDYEIPEADLVNYWINEGSIDGWNNLQEAEDKGFAKVKELIDASLVEKAGVDFRNKDCVKMHDVMRDLALRISSTNSFCRSFVRAGVKLSEMPEAEDWETARRISLMNSGVRTLPQMALNCGMLTTLLLQGNSNLREIPSDFFEHMPALQVLDLSWTGISSLPPSIGNLADLRGLYLNYCLYLKVIPGQIGGLTKLEIFQVKGNTICYLPPEVEELASLKYFEVKCGPKKRWEKPVMKMFPRLSKLSGLERLGIFVDEYNAKWWGKYHSKDVSMEISKLDKLTHLLFTFSKFDYFEDFVQRSSSWKHRNLTTFRISIGFQQEQHSARFRDWDEFYLRGGSFVRLDGESTGMMVVYNDVTKIIDSDEILTRVNSLAVVDELPDLRLDKLQELKCFFAIRCNYVETLVLADSDGKKNTDLLPSLQQLFLYHLPNMKSIWEGPLTPPPPQGRRCFPSLTQLDIIGCHGLKRIFTRRLIAHLSNLQDLSVQECEQVEEIISIDQEEEEIVPIQEALLPQLKSLTLRFLPKLRLICSSKELSSAGWPSLETIDIGGCQNLKSLPAGFAKAPNLELIRGWTQWWEALEWEDDALKQQLCSKYR